MRHDPRDPHWLGRDRFVLSCGHSSLTLYIQLYLSGYGLELATCSRCGTWGSPDSGPPGVRAHRRRRDHDRPARPGRRQRGRHGDGRAGASAVCSTRTPPAARACSTTTSTRSPPTATWRRASPARRQLARRHPAAGQPHPDLRRQLDLDRGRHQHRVHRGRRPRATRRTAGTSRRVDWRGGADRAATTRTSRLCTRRCSAAQRGDRPAVASSRCARSSAGRRPTSRTPARSTARRSAPTRSPPPRRCSASTRTRPSTSPDDVLEHAARRGGRGAAGSAGEWDERYDAWRDGQRRSARRCSTGCRSAGPCPPAGPTRCRRSTAEREGHGHPQGLRRRAHRDRPGAAGAVGRLGRPRRVQQHHARRASRASSRRTAPPRMFQGDWYGRMLHFGIREHAHGLDPQRHRPARRHPAVRRHVPGLQRLHAPGRSGWPR